VAARPKIREASRDGRWAWALAVSVLLHLGVSGLLLWRNEKPVEKPVEAKPLEVQIVMLPRAFPFSSGGQAGESSSPAPVASAQRKKKASKKSSRQGASASGRLELRPDMPGSGAVVDQPRLSLLPTFPGSSPSVSLAPGVLHGETVYNDGGVDDAPEWQAMRAEATVQRWAKDSLAENRAQRGLVHPYYSDMRRKLQELTASPPPFHPEPKSAGKKAVEAYWNSWKGAREAYGKTGQPYATPEGYRKEFEIPNQLQKMADRGDANAAAGAAMMYAKARLRDLGEGRMGIELEAQVELRQSSEGAVLSTTLVKSSDSKSFDTFVVDRTPVAAGALLDDGAVDVGKERRSVWAFIGSITYFHKMDEATTAPDRVYAEVLGALLGSKFEEVTQGREYIDLNRPVYHCRVKLLAVEEE
jgi:hypothetical protein